MKASKDHAFGGRSTDLKLSLVEGYLNAFTLALNGKYQLWYIDAFAGTGERTVHHAAADGNLLEESSEARIERLRGSARIALEVDPPFDRLIFVDNKRSHVQALEDLALEYPERNVTVLRGDANKMIVQAIKSQDWSGVRAVMFLDPYGMHVEWDTLREIQSTRAIDVWYLVSLAGLFRQAAKNHNSLSGQKRNAINRMLGTNDWEKEWYSPKRHGTLFEFFDEDYQAEILSTESSHSRTANVEDIESFVLSRLKGLFPSVLKPLRLRNSGGVSMFSLFFSVSNPDPLAIGLATRIANHMLKAGNSSQVRSRK